MFATESHMAAPVARWLKSGGMAVKSEFVTPWGICDLVGLTFNPKRVERRLQLRQTRAIGSITRALLLLHIPDIEKRKATTLGKLVRQFAPAVPAEVVSEQIDRLIADRFVVSSPRGRLQKRNGWIPLQDRLVAVELKLSRIGEALRQALDNRGFAEHSYAAFPCGIARRVAANPTRWLRFFDAGVGLLSVTKRGCRVLIPPHQGHRLSDAAIEFYCVEKFWRTRSKTAEHKRLCDGPGLTA